MATEVSISVEQAASSKKTGMTLGELAVVVQDAYRLDIDVDAIVHVTAGWSQQLQTIRITTGKKPRE